MYRNRIRFSRFMQWWSVVFGTGDFAAATWRAVTARWGWMIVELAMTGVMVVCWRVQGRIIERYESMRLEQELWQ